MPRQRAVAVEACSCWPQLRQLYYARRNGFAADSARRRGPYRYATAGRGRGRPAGNFQRVAY